MELEHQFTVPAPVDVVWKALLDPELVAPCMPGATITSASGDEFAGTVKVRLGPIALQYKGSGKFTEADESAHRAVIEASGKDARGNGTASATVTATLTGNGEATHVTVVTDLSVTGKPAQFGRGLLSEVGGKIIGQFADCLAGKLGPQQEPAAPEGESTDSGRPADAETDRSTNGATHAAPAAVRPVSTPVADEINLLDTAGAPLVKRLAPVVVGLIVLFIVVRWLRRR